MHSVARFYNNRGDAYDRKIRCGKILICFKTLKFEFVCTLCHLECSFTTFYDLFDHVTKEHSSYSEEGDPPISVYGDYGTIEDPLADNIIVLGDDEIKSENEDENVEDVHVEDVHVEAVDVEDVHVGLKITPIENFEPPKIILNTATNVKSKGVVPVKNVKSKDVVPVKKVKTLKITKRYILKNVHCNLRECRETDTNKREQIIKLIRMYRKCVGLWHKKTASRTSVVLKSVIRKALAEKYDAYCLVRQIRLKLLRMTMCFNEAWKTNAGKEYRPWFFDYMVFLKFADAEEVPDGAFEDFVCPFCATDIVIACGAMDLWNHIIENHKNVGNVRDSESNLWLWPTEHLLRFIAIYREHEILWNTKCREYYDRPLKAKAYQTIIEKFNGVRPKALDNRDTVVETIRQLRVYFRRFDKKYQVSNVLEKLETPEEIENNKIYEELLFLKNVYFPNQMHFSETFSCDMCEKTFKKKCLIHEHFKWRHKDSIFRCDKCPMVFGSQGNLESHRSTHYIGDGKTYSCAVCHMEYSNSNDLETHLFDHIPSKFHDQICEICGAKFKDRNNLSIHLRRHCNIKNYGCEVCQKRFVTSTELKLHSFMHSDERAFVCEICGQEFKYRHHLSNHHLRFHEEPRFKCNKCGIKFLTRKHFHEHEKSHAYPDVPAEKIVCELCRRLFGHPTALAQHKRRMHNIRKRDICDRTTLENSQPLIKKPKEEIE